MRFLALLSLLLTVGFSACQPEAPSDSTAPPSTGADNWPQFGPEHQGIQLNGHTNSLPDFVGPVDGSARLTIFTEGNHFPVLLPLVFEVFPDWCTAQNDCEIAADEILIVTLPQVIIVEALTSGSIKVGNATLGIRPGRIYPQIVMGGEGPLRRLAAADIVQPEGRPFARHRGMGLLVRHDVPESIETLQDLSNADVPVVLATPREAGARRQYRTTLTELLGTEATERIFEREVPTFSGRLGIQHRDVPYALLQGDADAGLIFGHLANFYAQTFPDRLQFVPVEAAAPFGQTILLTRTTSAPDNPGADAFVRFLMERARTVYPDGGFAPADEFAYGQRVELTASFLPEDGAIDEDGPR